MQGSPTCYFRAKTMHVSRRDSQAQHSTAQQTEPNIANRALGTSPVTTSSISNNNPSCEQMGSASLKSSRNAAC